MLVVDSSFTTQVPLIQDEDLFPRIGFSFLGTNVFLEEVRSQISEIKLVQLIPGISILFFLSGISFLIGYGLYYQTSFLGTEYEIDEANKPVLCGFDEISLRIRSVLFLGQIVFLLQTLIPLGLECFNSYEEKNIETTWAFQEIFGLEQTLVTFLCLFSQFPTLFLLGYKSWTGIRSITLYWKLICLILLIFAGIVTPTIDSYTQISFALVTFSLYSMIVNGLEKRIRQVNFIDVS